MAASHIVQEELIDAQAVNDVLSVKLLVFPVIRAGSERGGLKTERI